MTRKLFMALLLTLVTTAFCAAQNLKDKMYFDSKWNVVQSAGEATFYRLYNANDKSNGPKPFQDYYMSGVMQSKGQYTTLCKTKDKETVFQGLTTFYNEKGQKTTEITYKNSNAHGPVNYYDPETGTKIKSYEYRDGDPISCEEYDPFGGRIIIQYSYSEDGQDYNCVLQLP